jgi:hypothetical protein
VGLPLSNGLLLGNPVQEFRRNEQESRTVGPHKRVLCHLGRESYAPTLIRYHLRNPLTPRLIHNKKAGPGWSRIVHYLVYLVRKKRFMPGRVKRSSKFSMLLPFRDSSS